MVLDYLTDLEDNTEDLWLPAWRCVACGQVMEQGIVHNRLAQEDHPDSLVERLQSKARKKHGPVRLGV